MVIAKTIAGFLNAQGGTLIIGVDDHGTPTGLANDLSLGRAADHDRFQLWLIDHVQRTADFYVRIGDSTRRLLSDELLRYRETRWD